MSQKNLPIICPGCNSILKVQRLACEVCNTFVDGTFNLPILAQLPGEDQEFIYHLIQVSGSLKSMAAHYNISYPTVRNRLDLLIERILSIKNAEKERGEGIFIQCIPK